MDIIFDAIDHNDNFFLFWRCIYFYDQFNSATSTSSPNLFVFNHNIRSVKESRDKFVTMPYTFYKLTDIIQAPS